MPAGGLGEGCEVVWLKVCGKEQGLEGIHPTRIPHAFVAKPDDLEGAHPITMQGFGPRSRAADLDHNRSSRAASAVKCEMAIGYDGPEPVGTRLLLRLGQWPHGSPALLSLHSASPLVQV